MITNGKEFTPEELLATAALKKRIPCDTCGLCEYCKQFLACERFAHGAGEVHAIGRKEEDCSQIPTRAWYVKCFPMHKNLPPVGVNF